MSDVHTPTRVEIATMREQAVLSFTKMSADRENEYFCDGLSEELINAFSPTRELRVVSRTSAFAFKGKESDIREVGKILNVRAVLEGSVRKSGHRLRVTAQLMNVEDGFHLWSGQFDREMKDVFDIQEKISLTIVDHLTLKLLQGEKEKILRRATDDHEAYDCNLKGRYFRYRRDERGRHRTPAVLLEDEALTPCFCPACMPRWRRVRHRRSAPPSVRRLFPPTPVRIGSHKAI